ncbi:MAG: zinc-binding dehydrogenase [Deltaproteobacteria bacterium]|nr:zinc-binding dehydrogenase [Deltaproteobacteria bacterium]
MSRVVMVTGRGGPDVLEVVERAAPSPGRGAVRIAVEAAGVAFGDVMRRRGMLAPRPPFTPGYDVVGRVEAVGQGAEPALVGRRVAAMMPKVGFGGYADHVVVPVARLVQVPDGVDPVDAVCLGLNYITAYQLLHRIVPLGPGKRALIHGAAGGVGTALMDLGQRLGVELYGTASAGKHALLRERGATPIDYRSEDFVQRIAELTGDGVDAVFDSVGGAHLRRSYRTLRRGGTLVSFGLTGDSDRGWRGMLSQAGIYLGLKLRFDRIRLRLYMITATPGTGWRRCRQDWAALLTQHARGELAPLVGARVPLADVRHAHELVDGARVTGKVVLLCGA